MRVSGDDSANIRSTLAALLNYWNGREFEYLDYLARSHGWHPLNAGQQMTVTIGGKQFEIKRID